MCSKWQCLQIVNFHEDFAVGVSSLHTRTLRSSADAGQTWQTVVGGGGGASYTGAGQYQDSSPCAENVGVLQTVAEGFLTDPRQAALVDWGATTCADALGLLNKYGLACEVRPHHCMLQAS